MSEVRKKECFLTSQMAAMTRKMIVSDNVRSRASEKTIATTKANIAKRHGREDRMRLKREDVIL
jgi:hypothetical protein